MSSMLATLSLASGVAKKMKPMKNIATAATKAPMITLAIIFLSLARLGKVADKRTET
jgi:hypothetical protein